MDAHNNFLDPDVATFLINNRVIQRIRLPTNAELIIGRRHQNNFVQPDLDLFAHQALEHGVSRLHAKLAHNAYGWWLEDLGSVNGTFANGKQLIQQTAIRLEVKNRIIFGRLHMQLVLPHKAYGSMLIPIEAANAIPMHIVHIEDDKPLQGLFRSAIKEVAPHIKLTQFIGAEGATDFIAANAGAIDLYIIDIRLPGRMNGLEIAHMIRKLGCPGFIVLTSAYGSVPPQLLARLGCEFLPKPMHMLEVLPRLLSYRILRVIPQVPDLTNYRESLPNQPTRILKPSPEEQPSVQQTTGTQQAAAVGSNSALGAAFVEKTSLQQNSQEKQQEKPTKSVLQRILKKLQSL